MTNHTKFDMLLTYLDKHPNMAGYLIVMLVITLFIVAWLKQ